SGEMSHRCRSRRCDITRGLGGSRRCVESGVSGSFVVETIVNLQGCYRSEIVSNERLSQPNRPCVCVTFSNLYSPPAPFIVQQVPDPSATDHGEQPQLPIAGPAPEKH